MPEVHWVDVVRCDVIIQREMRWWPVRFGSVDTVAAFPLRPPSQVTQRRPKYITLREKTTWPHELGPFHRR